MEQATQNSASQLKRRFPRRRFPQQVGVLFKGEYLISESFQIGEGGMLVASPFQLLEGNKLVVSFMIPGRAFVIVKAQVQYLQTEESTKFLSYGLKFLNLSFVHRRKLRDFIAAKTEAEAQEDALAGSIDSFVRK